MFWPTFLAITICPFDVLYNSSLNMINFASWCFPMTSTVLLELIVSEQWSRHSPDNEFMQLLVCRLNQSAKKHVMSIAVLIGSEGEYFFPFVDPVIKKCAYVVKWCPTKVIMQLSFLCRERGEKRSVDFSKHCWDCALLKTYVPNESGGIMPLLSSALCTCLICAFPLPFCSQRIQCCQAALLCFT